MYQKHCTQSRIWKVTLSRPRPGPKPLFLGVIKDLRGTYFWLRNGMVHCSRQPMPEEEKKKERKTKNKTKNYDESIARAICFGLDGKRFSRVDKGAMCRCDVV